MDSRASFIRVHGSSADDPDGAVAGAIVNAYVNLAWLRSFRWQLWRRFALIALAAWFLEACTPILPRAGLEATLALLVCGAIWALGMEHRAAVALRAAVEARGDLSKPLQRREIF